MTLKLKYPINPFFVNYVFGRVTDLYTAQGLKGHNGIDLQAYRGQPIYASHDGICYPEVDNAGGNGVVIRSLTPYELLGGVFYIKTIYWHLLKDNAVVQTGQQVKTGELIGYADNTGVSTGDHLHFGLKTVAQNETDFTWYNTRQTNGYFGAIDPMPYFDTTPLKYIFKKVLRKGMWNSDVKELQKFLNTQGYKLALDGIFGDKTFIAVKDFQLKNKLVSDGIVGALTNAKINLI